MVCAEIPSAGSPLQPIVVDQMIHGPCGIHTHSFFLVMRMLHYLGTFAEKKLGGRHVYHHARAALFGMFTKLILEEECK